MYRHILVRFLQSILSLYVLLTIVFFSARLSGDPLDLLLGESATKEQEAKVRAYYGLDKPVLVQYRIYFEHLLRGDLGRSIERRRPVAELIIGRMGASIQLIGAAMAISLCIGVIIGVYCAINRGRFFDLLGRSFAAFGQSLPVFWLGLMLMLVFAVWLDLLPTSGRGGLKHLVLPAVTLGYALSAGILRLTRSAMLDVLDSEYVKLARIKGVSEFVVIWKHAFKNALLPVVTYSVVLLASVVASAVVTETVFAWPGLGQLIVQAVVGRDFPLIQGIVLFVGSFVLIANLVVDMLYAYLDPKIRHTD
jgi:ABC-type dipeptide/oligopeptide/nickel transport system permease component